MRETWARARRRSRRLVRSAWDQWGPRQGQERLAADAGDYWRDTTTADWKSNSHWRDGVPEHFDSIGAEHLALLQRLAAVRAEPLRWSRVLEWGSGGGANAVAVAPLAEQLIAVDVVQASLDECARQVAAVCPTPVTTVQVDVDAPRRVLEEVDAGSCDVILCLYVLELVPSTDYAVELLRLFAELLAPGGCAFVQFRYREAGSRSPRRDYRRHLAQMTRFDIDRFWTSAQEVGLRPEALHLVPRNALDACYAYALLSRP